jgi:hypothetical protein
VGGHLPIGGHKSSIRTFENVDETHDPISMRPHAQCRAGGISRDQTGPFAYNKRRVQKPYPFPSSYLEVSLSASRVGTLGELGLQPLFFEARLFGRNLILSPFFRSSVMPFGSRGLAYSMESDVPRKT